MRGTNLSRSEQGQMLLATGVLLMMALLSMAVYGVRTAGISTPYDPGEDAAVETAGEVLDLFGPVLEARALGWVNAGYEPAESIEYALESLRDDLLHHGEVRGVEIMPSMRKPTSAMPTRTLMVTGEFGLSDRSSTIEVPIRHDRYGADRRRRRISYVDLEGFLQGVEHIEP